MKKLLSIVVFGSMIFFNFGCQKCMTCVQTTTTSVNVQVPGYPQVTRSTFEACGDELKSVNGKTITATSTYDGITATAVTKTICN